MKLHQATVDMALAPDERKNASGRTCVHGAARAELKRAALTSRVLTLNGPAGGNPVVMLTGSRRALAKFLAHHGYVGVTIAPRACN